MRTNTKSPKKKPLERHFFGLFFVLLYLHITQFTASFSLEASFKVNTDRNLWFDYGLGRGGNWNVLIANLKRQGVEVHFKHKGQTDEIQGVVFIKNGYHFNGSKVDRRFSYSKIDAALQRNRREEYMELASAAKGNGLGQADTPTPSVIGHGEFFSGSLGLLNGNSSYNAADAEANLEMAEILRRKKKTKRKKGLGL